LVCGHACEVKDTTTFNSLECTLPTVKTIYLKDQGIGKNPNKGLNPNKQFK
jgi:hypothetical protein